MAKAEKNMQGANVFGFKAGCQPEFEEGDGAEAVWVRGRVQREGEGR